MSEFGRAERRAVTALFVDISGFTSMVESSDVEEAHASISAAFGRASAIVTGLDGTVEKYAGDAMLALFGAGRSHRDDVDRAVTAAIAVRDALTTLGLSMRAGIELGEVLVNVDRVGTERDLMVLGDAINTAARLQQHASRGDIVLGPTAAAAATAETTELASMSVKGKSEPVPAFLVVGAPRGQRDIAFVGRANELDVIASAAARARDDRRGVIVCLTGAPGIGKSRLVAEATLGSLGELRVARCRPPGEGTTAETLREVLGPDAADSVRSISERLVAANAADPARMAEMIAASSGIIDASPERGSVVEYDAASSLVRETAVAWRTYLRALAEPVVALVIEDAHWASPDLFDLLVPASSDEQSAIVTVFAGWEVARSGMDAVMIELGPLARNDAVTLATAHGAAPDDIDDIVERAEGSPLFIEELVRSRSSAGELPLGLRAAVAASLDRLGAPERARLGALAVLGSKITAEALAAVAQIAPEEARETIAALVHARLLEADPAGPVARFRHRLTAEVAYTMTTRKDRKDLHAAAADRLSLQGEDPAVVAPHLAAAERWQEAADAFALAATAAAKRLALNEAERASADAIQVALEHLDGASDFVAGRAIDRGQLLIGLNRLEDAVDAFALAALHASASPTLKARASAGRATSLFWSKQIAAAEQAAVEAERWAGDDPLARAEASAALAFVRSSQGRPLEGYRLAETAGSLAERAGDPRLQAFTGMMRVFLLHHAGRSRQASEEVAQVVAACRREGLPGPLLWALFKGGLGHAALGRYAHALDAWDELDRIVAQTDSPWYSAEAANCRGHVARELGEWGLADEHDHRCIELADAADDLEGRVNAELNLVASALSSGSLDHATERLARLEPRLAQVEFFQWRAMQRYRYYAARLALADGRVEDAVSLTREAMVAGERAGEGKNVLRPALVMAEIAAADDPGGAATQAAAVGARARTAGLGPIAWRAYAAAFAWSGRDDMRRAALDVFGALEVPAAFERTHRARASALEEGDAAIWSQPL